MNYIANAFLVLPNLGIRILITLLRKDDLTLSVINLLQFLDKNPTRFET